VILLAQISQQLKPNGSQIIIPPLQPLEQFILNPSDLRVNIFWYMSLGFSITAALGATLVQQWVRDYLLLFQRLSGSLERSRLRQYLFHGLSTNYMALLVKCIPIFPSSSSLSVSPKICSPPTTLSLSQRLLSSVSALPATSCSQFTLYSIRKPLFKPHCLTLSG
jgi:hypothetical protein